MSALTDVTMTETQAAIAKELNRSLWWLADWALRSAIVHAIRDGGRIAPAYYQPGTGDVTIDLDVATDYDDATTLANLKAMAAVSRVDKKTAKMVGLLQHEAAHSRWSDWMMALRGDRVAPRVFRVAELFEEIRVEKRAIDKGGDEARKPLRAAFDIVLGSLADADFTDPMAAAHAWGLTVGRVQAGAVMTSEVAGVDSAARTLLTDDVVDVLTEILDEAVEIDASTAYGRKRVVELAREWLEVLGVDERGEPGDDGHGGCRHGKGDDETEGSGRGKAEKTEDESDDETEGGSSGSGDEEGDDEAEGGDDGEDREGDEDGDDESLDAGVGSPGFTGDLEEADGPYKELSDEQAAKVLEKTIESAKKKVSADWDKKMPVELRNARKLAAEVFGKKKIASSASWHSRPPTSAERQAAKKLAAELERMTIPAVSKVAVPAIVPPGKLRGREAVRGSAERAQGRMVTARPWTATKRRHAHVPPIVVGIATDTSGSMRWAQELVAQAAFVVSHAGHRVSARYAAVTFGNHAEAVIRPGELPQEVRIREANGGLEAYDDAIAALDGVLHLTNGADGAKVLITVTDGHLVRDGEPARAKAWHERLHKAGVICIQVDAGGYARLLSPHVQKLELKSATVDELVNAIVAGLKKQMH